MLNENFDNVTVPGSGWNEAILRDVIFFFLTRSDRGYITKSWGGESSYYNQL